MAERGNKKSASASMVSLAWDLGFIFAVPLVVFALGGRFLDKKLDSSPLLLLLGIIIAAVTSSIGVFFKVRAIMRESQEVDKPKSDDTKQPPAV